MLIEQASEQASDQEGREDNIPPAFLVRRLRLRAGLSQGALADLAGCSQSTVSRIEAGLSPVLPELAGPLAHVLEIDRHHLRPDIFASEAEGNLKCSG